jgi:hypothetical protein
MGKRKRAVGRRRWCEEEEGVYIEDFLKNLSGGFFLFFE